MNIYIDESGSINNHLAHKDDFVIAIVLIEKQRTAKSFFKRFVSKNLDKLRLLDEDKFDEKGVLVRQGGKMFKEGKFKELKGSQFDYEMRNRFASYFSKCAGLKVSYIHVINSKLSDHLASNSAVVFNYVLRLNLEGLIRKGIVPNEALLLQIDERNTKTKSRFFLEEYLQTEFTPRNIVRGRVTVQYFDSANNFGVQIADVFSNLYYSHLMTHNYVETFDMLKREGIIHNIFQFPL